MPDVDYDKIADVIREVAHDKIVPRFNSLKKEDVRSKSSPTDLVTIADEEAEIELTRILTQLLPGSLVLGEEAVSQGAVVRDILKDKSNVVWIVDPVDGTGNFAHGRPMFGTMVALVSGGEKIASWIYQIPRERMIMAQAGSGVTIDGNRFVPPSKPAADMPLDKMNAYIGTKFIPQSIRPYVENKISLIGDVTTCTCCAWEYIDLLEGVRTFSFYKRIEPWDHLAGVLILNEAGHYTRKWDGSDYRVTDLDGGLINAPNEELWHRIFDMFLKEPLETLRNA